MTPANSVAYMKTTPPTVDSVAAANPEQTNAGTAMAQYADQRLRKPYDGKRDRIARLCRKQSAASPV